MAQPQYEYSRPELLGRLSDHAVEAISSSAQRIVVCPTRPASLPWAAGYAEVRTLRECQVNPFSSVIILIFTIQYDSQ